MEWLRSDTLGAIHRIGRSGPRQVVRQREITAGAIDSQYSVVLRSGWGGDDLAVAMSASSSPMGHLHRDNGSIVIGTKGCWIIDDAGYQQYQNNHEREFTVGPVAHNCPVSERRDAERSRRRTPEARADQRRACGMPSWKSAGATDPRTRHPIAQTARLAARSEGGRRRRSYLRRLRMETRVELERVPRSGVVGRKRYERSCAPMARRSGSGAPT